MFQSLHSYFQRHHPGLSRMQWSDPERVSTLLVEILNEQQLPIPLTRDMCSVSGNTISLHGLTGGMRHAIVKKQERITYALKQKTGGVITTLQFR